MTWRTCDIETEMRRPSQDVTSSCVQRRVGTFVSVAGPMPFCLARYNNHSIDQKFPAALDASGTKPQQLDSPLRSSDHRVGNRSEFVSGRLDRRWILDAKALTNACLRFRRCLEDVDCGAPRNSSQFAMLRRIVFSIGWWPSKDRASSGPATGRDSIPAPWTFRASRDGDMRFIRWQAQKSIDGFKQILCCRSNGHEGAENLSIFAAKDRSISERSLVRRRTDDWSS